MLTCSKWKIGGLKFYGSSPNSLLFLSQTTRLHSWKTSQLARQYYQDQDDRRRSGYWGNEEKSHIDRRRQWHPLQCSCLDYPVDGGAWWAAVRGVAKSPTPLSDVTFTFHFHALEKKMATHSSGLAWRIPGMGEPGGLLSMGSDTTEVVGLPNCLMYFD